MEEISVNGENYVKASVLAKNFGYTADYLGQLCRGEQVKCTLVGRSWYVNEESLREHRKGRYRSSSAKSKEYLRRVIETQVVTPATNTSRSNLKYDIDEGELFPILNKPEEITVKETTSLSRDNGVEKDVNVAINKVISDVSQITIRKEINHRLPSPVLRTIPALRPNTAPVRTTKSLVVAKKSPFTHSRVSAIGTFAIFLGILIVESVLLFGVLGLEKRLVLADGNQAMVLYGFDAEKVIDSVKETIQK